MRSWNFPVQYIEQNAFFLVSFLICGLLAFYALHSDMYNEDSWCFVHELMQAAVGGVCSLDFVCSL